ncbi:MAG: hypothetical protein JSS76_10445 [Bacteroidetes bacterium]|nr:hypothetical protein [Bacteroidota bacterium]
MTDKRCKVWFYIDQEMEELVPVFRELFAAPELRHDYENVWEWSEGYSGLYQARINISRDHGGSWVEDDEPLPLYNIRPIMFMFFQETLSLEVYKEVAHAISGKLNVTTYWGYITIRGDDSYEDEILGSYPQ